MNSQLLEALKLKMQPVGVILTGDAPEGGLHFKEGSMRGCVAAMLVTASKKNRMAFFEDLEKVFDPFFTQKSKGTGLGLSICRQLASVQGGTIDIESEKGKGTIVTVELPMKKECLS